jgi:hypothetical protein
MGVLDWWGLLDINRTSQKLSQIQRMGKLWKPGRYWNEPGMWQRQLGLA